jgi:hypothetical protein
LTELGKVDASALWKDLDEATKERFGNSETAFLEEFNTAKTEAAAAFAKAGDVVADYMTADMAKGYAEKLGEVAAMAGGEVAKKSIIDATQELVSGLDSGVQQEIQSRINMTDWTNMEDLLALQIDLE